MNSNIDYFNTLVGNILHNLYRTFPIEVNIDDELYARAMGCEVIDKAPPDWPEAAPKLLDFSPLTPELNLRPLLYSTLSWLKSEGFIQADGSFNTQKVRLTARALTILNASPSALEPKLATKLADVVSGSVKEIGYPDWSVE